MEKRSEPPKGPRDLAKRYEELRQLRKKIEQLLAGPPLSLWRGGKRKEKGTRWLSVKSRII